MDLGTVYAYADAFANALLAHDEDVVGSSLHASPEEPVSNVISGYFSADAGIRRILQTLPRPIDGVEVLSVSPPLDSDEFISVIRISGTRQEVLLRAVWKESGNQPLIKSAEIIESRSR